MKRRITAILMTVVLTAASAFALTGCKTEDQMSKDSKTINVAIMKAGYGTSYIYELKEKFEAAYADEGYKLNVLSPSTDLTMSVMLQDIYSGGGADVYFPGNLSAYSAVDGEYGQCIEDISDLFDMQPLNLDGTEEQGATIGEKIDYVLPVIEEEIYYEDKYYGMPYTLEGSGMAVNMTVLEEYGYSKDDMPVTTNELFGIASDMMESINMGKAPYTFSMNGNGYCKGVENTWLIQYEGTDSYNEIRGFTAADGSYLTCTKKNCDGTNCAGHAYDVYAKEGFIETIAAIYELFDPSMQTKGVSSQDFKAAQAQLCMGKCAFYFVSGWMLNEQKETYSEEMKNIHFTRIPVLSALGPKLDLCGKGHVDVAQECFDDCAACEALLSKIVRGFDEGKTAEAVSAETGVSVEKVERVFEARSYVRDGSGSSAVINAKTTSEKKEIAKLLLRMLASDEGGELMAKNLNTVNPFNKDALVKSVEYDWTKETTAIFGDSRTTFFESGATDYRNKMGVINIYAKYGDTTAYALYGHGITLYDRSNDYALKGGSAGTRAAYRQAAYYAVWGNDKEGKWGDGIYGFAKIQVENGYWAVVK